MCAGVDGAKRIGDGNAKIRKILGFSLKKKKSEQHIFSEIWSPASLMLSMQQQVGMQL